MQVKFIHGLINASQIHSRAYKCNYIIYDIEYVKSVSFTILPYLLYRSSSKC